MKKFSILALVLVLTAALMAGCGDTMTEDSGKPTTNESSQATMPSTQATTPSTQATTPSTQATTPSSQATTPSTNGAEGSAPTDPSSGARGMLPRF